MTAIPDEVRHFVAGRIDSVGQLEVLMLLQSDPERKWTAAEVSREVGGQGDWAELQLEYLLSQGLLAVQRDEESAYRYAPQDPELGRVAEIVGKAFKKSRRDVVGLLFAHPSSDRVRSFADAFRLRRGR